MENMVLLRLSFLCRQSTLISKFCSTVNKPSTVTNSGFLVNSVGYKLQQFLHLPQWTSYRYSSSFFTRVTADQLWKGVTSVSNAGRRRGRGKRVGRKLARDLNRGQIIGVGKINMLWPGLNSPVYRGKEVVARVQLPPDEDREKNLIELRDRMDAFRIFKLHPLERGWSGTKMHGRSIGPPDPIGDETFEGFDTRVLEFKNVFTMKATCGRFKSASAFVVTGNKNGLAGFALGKAPEAAAALRMAKNKAAQALRYIELYKKHTILHDFYTSFGAVKIFVKQKPEGYGLVCHRAIKAICETVGIKDLYAKVEGPTKNIQNLTKAFFIGLMKQHTHQQLADRMGLHLVEFRKERDFYPEVIASPAKCRTEEEIMHGEATDFYEIINEGRVEEERKKFEPFYTKLPSWEKRLKVIERLKNQRSVKLRLAARYGEVKSFLNVAEEEEEKEKLKSTVEQTE